MMLVRRVEPIAGLPVVRIRVKPLMDGGRQRPLRTVGSSHIRYVTPSIVLRLTTDAPLSYIESESAFALTAPIQSDLWAR